MTDLNTLIDPGEGWFIEDSADINDAGMIAASARNIDGRRRAVLLTPVQAHCPADFNADGAADSGDFFAFLGAFFAGSAGADFDNNGHADSADFFGYITAYFQGC